MALPLISAGDLHTARYALAGDPGNPGGLLDMLADIFRADPVTAHMPTVPLYSDVPMTVEMINRLPSPAITLEDAPHTTIRYELRFQVGTDIRPEDEIIVTTQMPPLRYRIVGCRTPADYSVFQFADGELQ